MAGEAADVIVMQWDVLALVLKNNTAFAVLSVLAYIAGGFTVVVGKAVKC